MANQSGTSTTPTRARAIVEEGVDIQARMHDLVSEALASGEFDLAAMKQAVSEALTGVGVALQRAVPSDQRNILRQVFDGCTAAVSAGAESARRGVEHAKTTGRRIAADDLAKFAATMKSLEQEFLLTMGQTSHALSANAAQELRDMVARAKATGTKIGPVARSAIATAAQHAPSLASETAKAGKRAALAVAGELAMGVSGVLSGLGSAIKRAQVKAQPLTKAKAGAKSAAKPAPKPTSKPAPKSAPKAAKKKAATKAKPKRK